MAHAHASSAADLNPGRLFDCSRIVALVTGGATGIGEMAASGLIQGGAKVIIASRKESELKSKTKCLPWGPRTSAHAQSQVYVDRKCRS
jgi:NAD(P)-dependent dehydrogenase (short-subunit alcohol dehydrogenase family)